METSRVDVCPNVVPSAVQTKTLQRTQGRFISLSESQAVSLDGRLTCDWQGPHATEARDRVASSLVRGVAPCLNIRQTVDAGERLGGIQSGLPVQAVLPGHGEHRTGVHAGERVWTALPVRAACGAREEGYWQ